MLRSEILRKAWRRRKREGGKGICTFCHKPIFAGEVIYNDRKYHKTCLAASRMGLSREQAGVANPRPPAQWWAMTKARVKEAI